MSDLDIAKKNLTDKKLTLSIVKDGKLIYNSIERGVLPLYLAVTSTDTKGASVADKVTGKGAALLCAYGQIAELHTGIMSKKAAAVLDGAGIKYSCDELVDSIKNRAGDGSCPVEKLTGGINEPQEAIEPIKEFLAGIGVLNG
jgi:hypothetical protein